MRVFSSNMSPKFIQSAFYKLLDLLCELIPKSFHEFFTAVGMLVMLIGFLYNLLENKIFLGKGDSFIVIGLFLIELGIVSYLVKVALSLISPENLLKSRLFLAFHRYIASIRNTTILRAFAGFLYRKIKYSRSINMLIHWK